ncbi:TetR/AcrR family transcriptional regulator [Thalassotalea sp. PS06]|uniref:TetR/AcrR family transcriptional regulator n=1 Tax=Thalassotalea sp. PS06 TaxID=2594005 RepID=UPI001164B289|nr:TetR-like C-terminal domain-containing protein [Thalassotalea sp. PS06]QDP02365.1 TetR/AcrR family transcriptional regulator [Thalassotalea sp. PS06]
MYHIKQDKRSERSAEKIYQGLNELLQSKKLSEITVSEVCKVSGVGRTTFYRNFDIVTDVLAMKCDLCFKEVLAGFVQQNGFRSFNKINLLRYYISYWISNWKVLDNIVKANRIDIIYKSHLQGSRIIETKFNPNPHLSETERRYFIAMKTGETISILTAWIEGGRKESPEQLFAIVQKFLH